MNVLIFSHANDVHASAVDWGLRQRGANCRLVAQADFPERLSASVWFGGDEELAIYEPEQAEPIGPVDVVWNRRVSLLSIPKASDPADEYAIRQQGTNFLKSMRGSNFVGAFWINDDQAQARGSNKLLQLRIAEAVGLSVPPALVSNNPPDIRRFLGQAGTTFIAKPLSPLNWHGEDYLASAYTAEVRLEQCQSDEAVQWLPMIYQRKIDKAFELRVVVMGRTTFAAKIHSQDIPDAALDWRVAQERPELKYERFDLPAEIETRIYALMDRLGIVFGSLDFIVDPDGKFWFLEVNEQGQFLFVEQSLPEIPLLDAFVQFCLSTDKSFVYRPGPDRLDFNAFLASDFWTRGHAERLKLHVEYTPRISELESARA